jgi:hypothetical protein
VLGIGVGLSGFAGGTAAIREHVLRHHIQPARTAGNATASLLGKFNLKWLSRRVYPLFAPLSGHLDSKALIG